VREVGVSWSRASGGRGALGGESAARALVPGFEAVEAVGREVPVGDEAGKGVAFQGVAHLPEAEAFGGRFGRMALFAARHGAQFVWGDLPAGHGEGGGDEVADLVAAKARAAEFEEGAGRGRGFEQSGAVEGADLVFVAFARGGEGGEVVSAGEQSQREVQAREVEAVAVARGGGLWRQAVAVDLARGGPVRVEGGVGARRGEDADRGGQGVVEARQEAGRVEVEARLERGDLAKGLDAGVGARGAKGRGLDAETAQG